MLIVGPALDHPHKAYSLGNNWELNLRFSQHIPSIGNSELLFLLFEAVRAREYDGTI